MKKTYYLLCLLKRWALLLSIAIIIGVLITSILEPMYLEDELDWNASHGAGTLEKYVDLEVISGINTDATESEKEAAINKAVMHLCFRKNTPEIIRESTRESILPQEDVVVFSPDILKNIYSCSMSYFEPFEWKNTEWGYGLSSYYYNGNKFYPGILETEWPRILPEKFVTYDLTPENTEGYTYSDQVRSNLIMFYEAPHYSQDIIEEKLESDVEVLFSGPSQSVYYKKAPGYMKYKCYEYTYTYVGEEKFTLIYVYEWDLWRYYDDIFIPIYIGLFMGSLIIAAFIALFDYKNQEKMHYQKMLTSALAHDLKSPLTVISGYTENLDANLFPEKRDFYIQGIEENVGYMSEIITNILESSRPQAKKRGLNKENISIAELCNEILSKYKTLIDEKLLNFSVEGDMVVKGNRISVTRAFDNLINNAIKHSPEKGMIYIQISKRAIEISNSYSNKITCKPRKLLEPFVKGDSSRGTSGMGLGLYIVDDIMNKHGFYVDVKIGELFKVKLTAGKLINKIKRNKMFFLVFAVLLILIIGAFYIWRYNNGTVMYVS